MTTHSPISTIVFDVNETLLDFDPLDHIFEETFGSSALRKLWFAELILQSQCLTLSGQYVPFGTLAGEVLRMVGHNHSVDIGDDLMHQLISSFATLPAYPDVAPALKKLRSAGFRLMTLTNSAPSGKRLPIEAAGLGAFFERNFSVDTIHTYKPHPGAYNLVAEALEEDPSTLCMVACHGWDTVGAQSVGWQAAFVTRPGNSFMKTMAIPQPRFICKDMLELADQICASQSV